MAEILPIRRKTPFNQINQNSLILCRKVKDNIKSNILWVIFNFRNYACCFYCRCFNANPKNFYHLTEKYSVFMSQENEMLLHMNKEKHFLYIIHALQFSF